MSIPTPHNSAKKGDIAKKVLMPGDPLRAKYIAETYLENPVCFNTVRNMFGYTGTYKGEQISVMGNDNCRSRKLHEGILENLLRIYIEMVCRFIQQ